jgi:hypothetical protein
VLSGTLPVRGWIQVWSSTDRVTWRSIAGPVDTGVDGVHTKTVWPRRTTYYRAAVTTSSGGGWLPPAAVRVGVRVTKWPVNLVARATAGRPDVVSGHLTSATTGRALPDRRVYLQRRFAGVWRTVASDVTSSRGWASKRVQPRRAAYYRWVYAGTTTVGRATSGPVLLRY